MGWQIKPKMDDAVEYEGAELTGRKTMPEEHHVVKLRKDISWESRFPEQIRKEVVRILSSPFFKRLDYYLFRRDDCDSVYWELDYLVDQYNKRYTKHGGITKDAFLCALKEYHAWIVDDRLMISPSILSDFSDVVSDRSCWFGYNGNAWSKGLPTCEGAIYKSYRLKLRED